MLPDEIYKYCMARIDRFEESYENQKRYALQANAYEYFRLIVAETALATAQSILNDITQIVECDYYGRSPPTK